MKKPSTQTMVMGHPAVAVPMALASGVGLLAGVHEGTAVLILITLLIIARLGSVSQQARAYRAWKAEWDAMAGAPARRAASPTRIVGAMSVAALMLVVYARPSLLANGIGYAGGRIETQHWLLALPALIAVALLVRFVRRVRRRPKAAKPVTVIAKPILPVPTLAEAYRALPPYCQHLLRSRS